MDVRFARSSASRWLQGRWDAFRACWWIPGADAALSQRLLNRQARDVATNAWICDLVLLFSAVAIPVVHPARPAWWPFWIGAMLVCNLLLLGRRQTTVDANGAVRDFQLPPLYWGVAVMTVLFGAGLLQMYLSADGDVRMFIVAIAVGAISAGAVRRSRLPLVSLIWVGGVTAAMVTAFLFAGQTLDLALVFLLPLYDLALILLLLGTSRQFVASFAAEVEAERQRDMVELVLREVEGSSSDWFWECDAQGRLTHTSPRLGEVLGRAGGPVPGVELAALLDGGGAQPGELALLRERLGLLMPFRDVVVSMQRGGQTQWWSLSAKPLFAQAGTHGGWRGVGVNISAAHRHAQALHRLANTDGLTGLGNRNAFNEFLASRWGSGSLALMLLDLDQFKAVNDAHGHAVGDQLLQAVGQRLRQLASAQDCVARLGGDEFALVLSCVGRPRAFLLERGEAILQALRSAMRLGALHIEVRASLGVAYTPDHARDSADLLRAADMALYAAKAAGRDTLRIYDEAIGHQARNRAMVTHDLAQALERAEFRLEYQQVVDAASGAPVGAEALLRWEHPTRGRIAPLDFIAVAEETGLIVPIGAWVLRQACADAVRWPEPLTLAVNLSSTQLHSHGLVDEVRQVLVETGLAPQRLELELTETALATDAEGAAAALAQLRSLGVRLALDDFGTGFSSLAYLQRFGFDRLKMDRAFVEPLDDADRPDASALAGAIVGLAGALGLACTAEGVESAHQCDSLRALGCTALQGYLFHRPVPTGALFSQAMPC